MITEVYSNSITNAAGVEAHSMWCKIHLESRFGAICLSALEWAMSEMLKSPKVMEEAQAEVRRVFKENGYISEADLQHLKYFKLIIKETLRLHPPTVQYYYFQEKTQKNVKTNGYKIRPKTRFRSLKFVLASKTSTVSVWISEIHSGERGRKHSQGKRFTSFSFALQIPYGRSLAFAIAAHRASPFRDGEADGKERRNWRKKNNMSKWSCEDEKRFQVALLCYLEDFPNQWEEIGNMLGLSKEMVYQQYQILKNELGQVSPPQHTNSSTNNQPHKNNKGSSWTYEEHALFLLGVQKYGKGHWKNISEKAVGTRNATQVASHAQKFYIRQREKETIVHSRGSIHDFTLANYPPGYLNDLLSSHPHLARGSYMIMQQPNSSIDRHLPLHNDHHSLPMTQLGTQIPSTLHESHQDALPAHYDLQLNQLSTPMNQVGPQNPSRVQLQNPCHQPNSQVVSESLVMNQADKSKSQ
ncbi:hypothetical protein K1719_023557 [Acacia pycnantha]|nr:hypothetical protein K1719_023557 [Acacia pycnantha]